MVGFHQGLGLGKSQVHRIFVLDLEPKTKNCSLLLDENLAARLAFAFKIRKVCLLVSVQKGKLLLDDKTIAYGEPKIPNCYKKAAVGKNGMEIFFLLFPRKAGFYLFKKQKT